MVQEHFPAMLSMVRWLSQDKYYCLSYLNRWRHLDEKGSVFDCFILICTIVGNDLLFTATSCTDKWILGSYAS